MKKKIISNNEKLVDKVFKILTKFKNNPKEIEYVFTELFEKDFEVQLNEISQLQSGLLKGLVISVKDLFDVKGYHTKGGTKFLQPDISLNDAKCISKIRKAGGLLIGHTNMTELAYSGLGINPHYGTPDNPSYPGAVPGGSTSGGAVSIALDLSDIAIGTDTGGSTRIPAAFTGITGFKPSQDNVSRDGVLTLSTSLDSVGLMAKNVEFCKLGYQAMRRKINTKQDELENKNLKFIIPSNFGFESIDTEIKVAFDLAKRKIIESGYEVIEMNVPVLDLYKKIPIWQFASVECATEYFYLYNEKKHLIDPNVLRRIERAKEVTAVEYNLLKKIRENLILEFNQFLKNNLLLMPTVTIKPPLLEKCQNSEFYDEVNLVSLRNTTLANYMNGCSISIPYFKNNKPIGIMLNATTNQDDYLLSVSYEIEKVLQR